MSVPRAAVSQAIDIIYGQMELLRSEMGERTTDADVRRLAEAFCQMDDDHQAKFFTECARIMDGWPSGQSHGRDGQAWYIGGNYILKCETSLNGTVG